MTKVTFTAEAVDALIRKNELLSGLDHAQNGGRAVPCLIWTLRTQVRNNDGREYELGPRFYCVCKDATKIEPDGISIELYGGVLMALTPASMFKEGTHRIGFEDGDFVLAE